MKLGTSFFASGANSSKAHSAGFREPEAVPQIHSPPVRRYISCRHNFHSSRQSRQRCEVFFLRQFAVEKVMRQFMGHREAETVELPGRPFLHQLILLGIQIDAGEIRLIAASTRYLAVRSSKGIGSSQDQAQEMRTHQSASGLPVTPQTAHAAPQFSARRVPWPWSLNAIGRVSFLMSAARFFNSADVSS